MKNSFSNTKLLMKAHRPVNLLLTCLYLPVNVPEGTRGVSSGFFFVTIQSRAADVAVHVISVISVVAFDILPSHVISFLPQTFRIQPPLCITKEDADFFVAVFNKVVHGYMDRK